MGHTLASRGINGTDLEWCVTFLNTVVSRGCVARVQEKTSIHATQSRLAFPEPQGTVPQTLTLLGGAGFIAWRLKHPFLGKCWRGLVHFWKCRARLGYRPALGITLEKALRHAHTLAGARDQVKATLPTLYYLFTVIYNFLLLSVLFSLCALPSVTQPLTRTTTFDLPRWEVMSQLNEPSAYVVNF